MTPKIHIIEYHSYEHQSLFNGIEDLEDSFGEQNHQYKSIADRIHGGTRDFDLHEKINSKEEAQFNNTGVKEKFNYIENKRKREHPVARSTRQSQEAAANKLQKRY